MTRASNLDQRIAIERVQPGGVRSVIATVWASRVDLSDTQRMAVGNAWVRTSRFVIRDSGAVTVVRANDFVMDAGKSLQVQGVKRTKDGRNRFLEITAKG